MVSGLVHPSYKWTNPTYPMYNQGCNPLTKWDEPTSGNGTEEYSEGHVTVKHREVFTASGQLSADSSSQLSMFGSGMGRGCVPFAHLK